MLFICHMFLRIFSILCFFLNSDIQRSAENMSFVMHGVMIFCIYINILNGKLFYLVVGYLGHNEKSTTGWNF